MKQILKKLIVNVLWFIMGRRNLVKFSRFLANESRLDIQNYMDSNGELLIQKVVLTMVGGEKPVVFDVGANVGEWTRNLLTAAKLRNVFPVVHLFEPCRGTFQTLAANMEQWNLSERAVINNVALSATVGPRALYSIGDNCGRNSLYPLENDLSTTEPIVTTTIDDYCRQGGISIISFIKIDTEGHDLEVAYGAKDALQKGNITCIQFEYNHRWIEARHYLQDAFKFLNPLGYLIGKITPLGVEFYEKWHIELETFREGNYVAVKRENRGLFSQVKWWNAT